MNFEERKRIAGGMLAEFLGRFTPPRGMSDDAQGKMISSIADAFARKLPISGQTEFGENIIKTMDKVLDSHDSYAWPPQAAFVKNMDYGTAQSKFTAPETFLPDDLVLAEKAMKSGFGVSEKYVWGNQSVQLLNANAVSRDVMDSYRRASVASFRSVYKSEAQEIMVKRLGLIVSPYFSKVAA